MSRLKDRLLNYHIQVKKFADDDQMILANDVLSMIEQLQDDLKWYEKPKLTFTCYEVKSCKEDVYSGNGLNFLGEKNYIVTTMECYKDILPDISSGKFAEHMRERFPESSRYFGVMVAIPDWAETTDEFEKPTPLDAEVRRWKLAVILPCRYGPRKRSMTELLFCMLRSGR